MFRYSLVLLAGLGAAAPATAATWADALFEELSKDFGSVPRGPTLVHPFRLTNKTKGTLNIANVRVSCGCVSAHASKSHLEPGETTAIVARMDTTRFTGPKSVTIFVLFDQPRYQEVRLWVQANGRDDFNVSPDTLSFGRVKRAATPTASATITFHGSDVKITAARSESNYIQPKIVPLKRPAGERAYKLTVALREDLPVGKWFSDVWLKTNSSSMSQIRVPLSVEVESALSVTPESVSLGQLKVNGESERRVIVRGIKPFQIKSIDAGDSQFTVVDSATEPKAVHVVTVKVKPAAAGDLSRKVRLVTDLEEDGAIEFEVKAQVVQ